MANVRTQHAKWPKMKAVVNSGCCVSVCVWEAERNSNSDSNSNRAVTAATITASTALACASVSISVALLWPRILTVPQAKATQRRPTRALFLLESLGVWENVLCIPGELKKQLKVLSLEVITPKREVLLKNVKKRIKETTNWNGSLAVKSKSNVKWTPIAVVLHFTYRHRNRLTNVKHALTDKLKCAWRAPILDTACRRRCRRQTKALKIVSFAEINKPN